MDCGQFRKLAGSDPQHLSAEAQAHCAQCAACAEYLQQMRQLDGLLKRALDVPASAVPGNVTALRRGSGAMPTRWFALAASVLLAVMLGAGVWLISPRQTLAAEVIAHMDHEPGTMVRTAHRVTSSQLDQVMRRAGVRLKISAQKVSLARACAFRDGTIPHLVVQTREGPVTVLVLPDAPVKAAQSFNEEGYTGTITPSGRGSIAIIADNSAAVQQAAAEVTAAIEWVDSSEQRAWP